MSQTKLCFIMITACANNEGGESLFGLDKEGVVWERLYGNAGESRTFSFYWVPDKMESKAGTLL